MISFAVVPILVQAGTAALPAIAAGATTLLAVVFRPGEWIRFWREKPAATALVVAAICFGGWCLFALGHRKADRAAVGTDWNQVALEILRREQMTASPARPGEAPRDLQPAWEFKRPGVSFLSNPVLRDGRVYGASCQIDVGGTFGSIFCLDAMTGQPIWEVGQIDGVDLKGFFSSPTLTTDGRYLLIGEGLHFDAECHLFCVDARTGKLHWKTDVPKNHVESSPAILGDIVVVGAGAIERKDHLPIASPGYMLRVRISDGRVLSRSDVADPESSPALGPDGVAYIGSGVNGCAVLAFAATGDRLWKTPAPYPATAAILLSDDLVVAGCGRGDFVNAAAHPAGAVLALAQSSGKVRWQTELGDAVLGSLSLGDGKIFCPVRDGTVVALDLSDGKTVWRQRIGNAPVLAGTARCGDCVYAVRSDGFLAILDVKSGQVIEQHALNDEADPGRRNLCVSTPLVADGRVFVGSETGGLRCFAGTASR